MNSRIPAAFAATALALALAVGGCSASSSDSSESGEEALSNPFCPSRWTTVSWWIELSHTYNDDLTVSDRKFTIEKCHGSRRLDRNCSTIPRGLAEGDASQGVFTVEDFESPSEAACTTPIMKKYLPKLIRAWSSNDRSLDMPDLDKTCDESTLEDCLDAIVARKKGNNAGAGTGN